MQQSRVDAEDKALVSAIIHMAFSLGLQTIAEGVETEEQLAAVRELGCRCAQGDLIDKRVPVPEFEANYLGA